VEGQFLVSGVNFKSIVCLSELLNSLNYGWSSRCGCWNLCCRGDGRSLPSKGRESWTKPLIFRLLSSETVSCRFICPSPVCGTRTYYSRSCTCCRHSNSGLSRSLRAPSASRSSPNLFLRSYRASGCGAGSSEGSCTCCCSGCRRCVGWLARVRLSVAAFWCRCLGFCFWAGSRSNSRDRRRGCGGSVACPSSERNNHNCT